MKNLGIGEVRIDSDVHPGPRDAQIVIRGLAPVAPSSLPAQEYLYDVTAQPEFDAVHTYAVVHRVLSMYEDMLGKPLSWRWQRRGQEAPLFVYPHAGVGLNALYSRSRHALYFFGIPGRRVFTCRSLDVVAHETGHAVLDALQPYWWRESLHPQTAGLHEAFGDLTAVFLILSLPDLVQAVIQRTNADLDRANFLSEFAEQLGDARGREDGLRNANNSLRLSQVSSLNSAYDFSRVFTGAVYDILVDVFDEKRASCAAHDVACLSQALSEAGSMVAQLTLRAIQAAPRVNATFKDVAANMLQMVREETVYNAYEHSIVEHFAVRKIFLSRANAGFVAHASAACRCHSLVPTS